MSSMKKQVKPSAQAPKKESETKQPISSVPTNNPSLFNKTQVTTEEKPIKSPEVTVMKKETTLESNKKEEKSLENSKNQNEPVFLTEKNSPKPLSPPKSSNILYKAERNFSSSSPERKAKTSFKQENVLRNKSNLGNELQTVKESHQSPLVPKKMPKDSFFMDGRNRIIHSDDIEIKIKARKRILDMLEDQTSTINEEALVQIQSRDILIEELTKELIDYRSHLKSSQGHEEKIKIKQLHQRIRDLEHERNSFQHQCSELIEQRKLDQANFEDEKNNYEDFLSSLNEEIDLIKTQLKNKEEENMNMLEDIKKLSEIIQQFKSINNELNKKVENQNREMEEMKVNFMENSVKVTSLNEVEASLSEYIKLYKKGEERMAKCSEELRGTQVVYDDLFSFCKYIEEQLEEGLKHIENTNPMHPVLLKIKNEIAKKKPINIFPKEKKNNKNNKIRDINEQLEKAYRDLKIVENQQKPLHDEIKGLKELIECIKHDYENAINAINQSSKTLQEYTEALKSEIAALRLEIGKKEVRITEMGSKLLVSENKYAKNEERMQKIIESRSLIDKEAKDYKEKLQVLQNQLQDKLKEISNAQKQNAKLEKKIEALHEEFWKKDTALLKIKKLMIIQQKTISEITTAKAGMPKNGETNEKLLKDLYEKDQKIEVLKDMLKSIQNKMKDGKNKVKDASLELSMEMYPEKYEKSEQELMNSLIAKTINKFFSLVSVNKTSPESPLDIARLLKKLRQDLRMYSAFNVRDLQNSILLLQQPLIDSKSHLNLDELIAIISKVAYGI